MKKRRRGWKETLRSYYRGISMSVRYDQNDDGVEQDYVCIVSPPSYSSELLCGKIDETGAETTLILFSVKDGNRARPSGIIMRCCSTINKSKVRASTLNTGNFT